MASTWYVKLVGVSWFLLVVIISECPVKGQTIDEMISRAIDSAQNGRRSGLLSDPSGTSSRKFYLMQLDMILTATQWKKIKAANKLKSNSTLSRQKRKGTKNRDALWKEGKVPFEIIEGIFDDSEKNSIKEAIDVWQSYTCVTFVNIKNLRKMRRPGIRFSEPTDGSCSSNVGQVYPNSPQNIDLGKNCRIKRIIIHEIGHALGLYHEHMRSDRNGYVKINMENVEEKQRNNFVEVDETILDVETVPYDLVSIMHYGKLFFSKNGKATIEPHDAEYLDVIGTAESVSFTDIKMVNHMYKCAARCASNITCPPDGSLGKDCRCFCPSNSDGTAVVECSDRTRCASNIKCPPDGSLGKDCRCFCPSNSDGTAVVECSDRKLTSPVPYTTTPSPQDYIRLNGPSPLEGRVEVFKDGEWGTVCDDDFAGTDAIVVCRILGLGGGVVRREAFYGEGSGPVHMNHVKCNGDELSLFDCSYTPVSSCGHSEDVGVQCGAEGSVRLINNDGQGHYGRVEIFHDEEWGTVCDDDFDTDDTKVVCRQLGFGGGTSFPSAHYGEGAGRIWMDQVRCDGYEGMLNECSFDGWGYHDCGHQEDASVMCDDGTTTPIPDREDDGTTTPIPDREDDGTTTPIPDREGQVRLINSFSESHYGRVEIYHNGDWGTVCDDDWGTNDARVVCRQMGFSGGIGYQDSYYGEGSGSIWMDQVNCNGQELDLVSCPFDGWANHNCGHSEDASVMCDSRRVTTATRPDDARITLTGGSTAAEGTVNVQYQEYQGTICDDEFDDIEATVICHMLGYSSGRAYTEAHFGEGSGTVVLDDMACSGNETSITQCNHYGWGMSNCGHSEDAGVSCSGDGSSSSTTTTGGPIGPTEAVRLVNGTSLLNGRVEVMYNGEWGTVCDDDWDNAEAEVVCRVLGFSGGIAFVHAFFGQGKGSIYLDDVRCSGFEESLGNCPSSPWGTSNCGHEEDAGVWCQGLESPTSTKDDGGPTGGPPGFQVADNIRLVDGPSDIEGRVEVFHPDHGWGTVCDDSWEDVDAKVVCRQLGLMYGRAVQEARYGNGSLPILMDDVACSGSEFMLHDCYLPGGWNSSNCGHSEDAGVACSLPLTIDGIRLMDGVGPDNGRLELLAKGEWGTVCDDNFGANAADVACRMLGYMYGGESYIEARYGQGEGSIILDDTKCFGNETNLSQCSYRHPFTSNCGHDEDVSVLCFPTANYTEY